MKNLMTIAVAALTCAAFAQEPAPKEMVRGPGRGPMMADRGMRWGGMMDGMQDPIVRAAMNPRVAEKLGLPEETQLKIKKADLDAQIAMQGLQEKIRAATEKQAELMKVPNPDQNEVLAAIDQLFNLRKQMAVIQAKRTLAIKALLTPEQQEQALAELKSFREERRGEGGPRGFRRGPRDEGPKPAGGDPEPTSPPPAE